MPFVSLGHLQKTTAVIVKSTATVAVKESFKIDDIVMKWLLLLLINHHFLYSGNYDNYTFTITSVVLCSVVGVLPFSVVPCWWIGRGALWWLKLSMVTVDDVYCESESGELE